MRVVLQEDEAGNTSKGLQDGLGLGMMRRLRPLLSTTDQEGVIKSL